MLRRLLLVAAVTVVMPLAVILVPSAANAGTTATCTGGVAVSQFSFSPGTVQVGQVSTLTLVLQNCGSQTLQGSSIWGFKFTGAGTGLPPGCPVLDPVAFGYSMAPGGTSTATLGLDDPIASCQATGIQATANVNVNGVTGTVASATANLVITQPATGGCHVTYTPGNWQGGSRPTSRSPTPVRPRSTAGR